MAIEFYNVKKRKKLLSTNLKSKKLSTKEKLLKVLKFVTLSELKMMMVQT